MYGSGSRPTLGGAALAQTMIGASLMAPKALPEQAYLKQRLLYDEGTGQLRWKRCHLKPNAWNAAWAGRPAFTASTKKGYKHGTIDQKGYLAHRVIWKIVHGVDPDTIDHINGDPSDNRLKNLRSIPSWENQKNMARSKLNTSGASGVHFSKAANKWCAKIGVNGQSCTLGFFPTFDEALAARYGAEVALGYHENHGREARKC